MASSFAGPNNTWCFLWGYLKSKAYHSRPVDLDALKQAVRDEILNITEETL